MQTAFGHEVFMAWHKKWPGSVGSLQYMSIPYKPAHFKHFPFKQYALLPTAMLQD